MDYYSDRPSQVLYRTRRDNPSFSSTLLDQIYRSIDESDASVGKQEERCGHHHRASSSAAAKKKHNACFLAEKDAMVEDHARRARMPDGVVVHRRSVAADFARSRPRNNVASESSSSSSSAAFCKHSCSSSSSDSSSGGAFSSSESESYFNGRSRSSRSPCERAAWTPHPKPIRTSVAENSRVSKSGSNSHEQLGSFVRTKSKALKIYAELKKAKQPISPGGRLASFLNSIFAAGHAKKKKQKITTTTTTMKTSTKSAATPGTASACSSASSFSRSCLSKTPSSSCGGKSKRSVRFCLDEESRAPSCTTKSALENRVVDCASDSIYERELEIRVMEENRRAVEAAKELLESYRRKKEEMDIFGDVNGISFYENEEEEEDEEEEGEEDDDAASYASSDLFELDNLSAIGIERYREELPVYETTHLGPNRAIVASGLVL